MLRLSEIAVRCSLARWMLTEEVQLSCRGWLQASHGRTWFTKLIDVCPDVFPLKKRPTFKFEKAEK